MQLSHFSETDFLQRWGRRVSLVHGGCAAHRDAAAGLRSPMLRAGLLGFTQMKFPGGGSSFKICLHDYGGFCQSFFVYVNAHFGLAPGVG